MLKKLKKPKTPQQRLNILTLMTMYEVSTLKNETRGKVLEAIFPLNNYFEMLIFSITSSNDQVIWTPYTELDLIVSATLLMVKEKLFHKESDVPSLNVTTYLHSLMED